MTRQSTDALLAEYRKLAVLHGNAMRDGESSTVNRAYDALTRIRLELEERGEEHRRRVLAFLDDDDPSVRSWAAVDALALAPDDGVRVLREVAAGSRDMVGLDAEMILKLWESGEWDTSIP